MLPVSAIGKPHEIKFLQTCEVSSSGFVDGAFDLHGALITVQHPANDKRTRGIPTQINDLPSCIDRVEDNFKVVGDDEPDDGSLGGSAWRDRRLNRQ